MISGEWPEYLDTIYIFSYVLYRVLDLNVNIIGYRKNRKRCLSRRGILNKSSFWYVRVYSKILRLLRVGFRGEYWTCIRVVLSNPWFFTTPLPTFMNIVYAYFVATYKS